MRAFEAVCLFLAACVPYSPPVPPDVPPIVDDAAAQPDIVATHDAVAIDSGLSTPCARACANIAAHGCEEMGQQCMATCEHLIATGLTPFSAECVYGASSLADLRRCPAVRCLQGH